VEDQIQAFIREKILAVLEAPLPLPVLTRRDARAPAISGKAMVVIGMRRAGKTSFLHQQRADAISAGRSPERLIGGRRGLEFAGLAGMALG